MLKRIFVLACLASLLASCGPKPVIVKTETVEVKVVEFKALDPKLLVIPKEPAAPPARCKDEKGRATVCNEDVFGMLDQWVLGFRKMANQLREITGLQPKEGKD